MNTSRTSTAAGSSTLVRAAVTGAIIGMAAALVMAMYAMIASATYQNHGFFTPLYHIASVFIAPKTLMTSMQQGMGDGIFYFTFGPAVLGALIHMMIGAMYGAVFAVAARALKLRSLNLVIAGTIWGAMVLVVSSWIGLPLAAAIFNSGDQITDMAKMVGYGTFLTEHLFFGLALGALLAIRREPRLSISGK